MPGGVSVSQFYSSISKHVKTNLGKVRDVDVSTYASFRHSYSLLELELAENVCERDGPLQRLLADQRDRMLGLQNRRLSASRRLPIDRALGNNQPAQTQIKTARC